MLEFASEPQERLQSDIYQPRQGHREALAPSRLSYYAVQMPRLRQRNVRREGSVWLYCVCLPGTLELSPRLADGQGSAHFEMGHPASLASWGGKDKATVDSLWKQS